MERKLYSIDNIMWMVDIYNEAAIPICPKDKMELSYEDNWLAGDGTGRNVFKLFCEECGKNYDLKRSLYDEINYIIKKIKAIDRENYEIIDIDGIKTPVTKKRKIDLENGYFCVTQVRDSKRGPQVVIYAGKKGTKGKSQVFVMPDEHRLSFDQNDINPADIFTKITAEFCDGTEHIIKKNNSHN